MEINSNARNMNAGPIPLINTQTGEVLYNDDEEITVTEVLNTNKNVNKEEEANPQISVNLDEMIKLEIKLRNETLLLDPNKAEFTIPMMVSLRSEEIKTENKASIDIVCVLDKSGSMRGEKLKLLKSSLLSMMEYLGERDRLSIVTFDSAGTRLTPLLKMNANGKYQVSQSLENVKASGGTDIAAGVQIGLEILKQRKQINNVSSILILSDGLDGNAAIKLTSFVPNYDKLIQGTYSFNTFGYGNDHDPTLMSSIADIKFGSFYFIDKLEKMDECFIDCLGGLVSVIGEDLKISVKPEEGIIIKKSYWDKFVPNNNSFEASITQLISGIPMDYLFEVTIPIEAIQSQTVNIASATVVVKGLKESANQVVTKACTCTLTTVNDPSLLLEDNQSVVVNFYRVKTAEATFIAKGLAEAKKYEEAKTVIESLKEEMENSPTKAFLGGYIKDLIAAINYVKPVKFETSGKHYMVENTRCNMAQRSNLNSNTRFSNSIQNNLLNELNRKKK